MQKEGVLGKEEWITAENIIHSLQELLCPREFNYLTIDLDGNDYYILKEILRSGYRPRLIMAEFNAIFNSSEKRTIKYDPKHKWGKDDYYGFSFAQGKHLFNYYGYNIVYQTDNLNLYAVLRDFIPFDDLEVEAKYTQINYHPHRKNAEWKTDL